MKIPHLKKIAVIALLSLGATAPTARAWNLDDCRYTNPVIWSDFPDPDVIRVGDTYYMVTTTMHLMPGCPILKSKDLVNWELASYVFDTLDDTPRYRLEGGTVYGVGQWATSLRYHDGKFYVLFSPNDHPYRSYIYTSESADGGWQLLGRCEHFHDSSMLFDDDGKVYVYSGTGQLSQLKPDLSGIDPEGINMKIFEPDAEETGLLEGSRAIKKDGKYYLLMISWPKDKPRRQVCYRADNITGPYEKKVILEDNFAGFPYVGQGCIVDDPEGNWWGMIFQDRNAVGRVLTLSPCRWIDGWPVIGDADGHVPAIYNKVIAGQKPTSLIADESFDGSMSPLWQWNHVPDRSAYSFTEAPGALRLHTSGKASSIYEARNTLTQRMEGPCCTGEVTLRTENMADGDVAGFGAFNGHSGLLSVKKENGRHYLVMHTATVNFRQNSREIESVDDTEIERVEIPKGKVRLRIEADFRLGSDMARFSYRTGKGKWKSIGAPFQMRFDYTRLFMGTRFAIYNYSTTDKGGWVDVTDFKYNRSDSNGEMACKAGL